MPFYRREDVPSADAKFLRYFADCLPAPERRRFCYSPKFLGKFLRSGLGRRIPIRQLGREQD